MKQYGSSLIPTLKGNRNREQTPKICKKVTNKKLFIYSDLILRKDSMGEICDFHKEI